jgi:hypothetical protein
METKNVEQRPEGTSQTMEVGSEKGNDTPKMYEESYVKEIIAARDEAKRKLRTIEDEKAQVSKQLEDEQLKAKGDYEALAAKLKTERETEHQELISIIKSTYLESLGQSQGIIKTEYMNLFNSDIKFSGLEISNDEEVKKAFETWKKENPHLFKEQKQIPKTDSKPFKKPDTVPELTREQRLVYAVQQRMAERKK